MRLIRALVPDDRRDEVYEALDGRDLEYFVAKGADRCEGESIVEVPVSDEAVGEVTDALSEAGADLDRYTVVESIDWAETPSAGAIRRRYADRYDRPPRAELGSLVDELNWDTRSFLAMLSLSAVVASLGILLGSPVVVVGAAVLAPLVNPMVTSGLGVVLGERWTVGHGLRLQALGLAVAAGSALAVGLVVRAVGLAPTTLSLPMLDLVATRLAPSVLTVIVGIAAGAAAAVSLTAESSLINVVGVMVAAALVPAAAASGLAVVWGFPLVALGSGLLVVATIAAINLGVIGTLLLVGYRPSGGLFEAPSRRATWRVLAAVAVLAAVLAGAGAATASHAIVERDVEQAVDDVLSDSEYAELSAIAVRSGYAGYSPLSGSETVVVEVSRPDGETYPDLADRLADRIEDETGTEVTVRVEFVDYRESAPDDR